MLTGIHPCYKCTITNKDLQLPPDQRDKAPARTLESMTDDYKKFMAAGAILKNAQQFNNVIRAPILDIEPADVSTNSLQPKVQQISGCYHSQVMFKHIYC